MRTEDAPAFFALLDDVWTLKGTAALSARQKALFFGALSIFSLAEVEAGLMAHIRHPDRSRFLPMPGDVILQINGQQENDGRPGPEEAWAQSIRARDERCTVVWTAEMAAAFRLCEPLLQAGDEVGARMAFKEGYQRLVAEARERRVVARWTECLGSDVEGRDAVLLPHVSAGRISVEHVVGPRIGLNQFLALPAPIGASETNRAARDKARSSLARLRDEIAARSRGPTAKELAAQADRKRTARLKREAAARAAQMRSEA